MKAVNIKWNVEYSNELLSWVWSALDELNSRSAAELLELPISQYANMTTSERHDYAYEVVRKSPEVANEILGLPDKVEIPFPEPCIEGIVDYLYDEYGFCPEEFDVSSEFVIEYLDKSFKKRTGIVEVTYAINENFDQKMLKIFNAIISKIDDLNLLEILSIK